MYNLPLLNPAATLYGYRFLDSVLLATGAGRWGSLNLAPRLLESGCLCKIPGSTRRTFIQEKQAGVKFTKSDSSAVDC